MFASTNGTPVWPLHHFSKATLSLFQETFLPWIPPKYECEVSKGAQLGNIGAG